jgi:hypothetical protein
MVVLPFPARSTDRLLRTAIHERRLISFTLHDCHRRAEPHDYGVVKGVVKLLFYQVGGRSQSGRPLGWRWAVLSEMTDVRILVEQFVGPREAERHVAWDELFASVSR